MAVGTACIAVKATSNSQKVDSNDVSQTKDSGEDLLTAKQLRAQGKIFYDPGFTSTACCTSRITYLDGDNGILRYRGYPIEQLAQQSSFVEVAYLLINGELPSAGELQNFEESLASMSAVRNELVHMIYSSFHHDAHPMGVLASVVMAMGTLYPEANPALSGNDVYKNVDLRRAQMVRVLASVPTLTAHIYRAQNGLAPDAASVPKKNDYTENFLDMLSSVGGNVGDNSVTKSKLARALDVLLILHADHELNCSTATMRQLTSSGVDVYSAIAGSMGALYGPLHGGATEAVVRMLEKIGAPDNVPPFLDAVRARKEKLMGFGHRIYKNYDPRAKIIKRIAHEIFDIVGQRDPLIDVATALEQAALGDQYFVDRYLYPNVDFYSGLIYKAIGLPTAFFPCMFAIGRTAGWLAHWNEFLDDPERKIARPLQSYKGEAKRDYVPRSSRTSETKSSRTAAVIRPRHGVLAKL